MKDQKQLSKKNVILTRQIVSLRIHVERAIGRTKQYHILSSVVVEENFTDLGKRKKLERQLTRSEMRRKANAVAPFVNLSHSN